MMAQSIDQLCINTIRFLSADGVEKAKSGHPGTPMALAPLAYVLWTQALKHNPSNHHWADRDRFILSAGHASMLIYSMLHLTGYELPLEELKQFRQWGSRTPGHPEAGHTAGVETTTGPLGQGVGNGVGMAMAERHLAKIFNRPGFNIVDHYTYVVAGDGDMMEGVSHEAASLAGHLGLGKLIMFYDDNQITIDGHTDLAFSEDVAKRYESYGWHVQVIENGNEDLTAIAKATEKAKRETGKPSFIVIKTTIAYGSPNKQNTHGAHGAPLGDEEIRLTKKALGWTRAEPFSIPEDAMKHMRGCVSRGEAAEAKWKSLFDKYAAKHPELAKEFGRRMNGELPQGWEKSLPTFEVDAKGVATRSASGKVLNAIAANLPELVGGSADLHPSTNTYLNAFGSFSKAKPEARNFHFGIREHAMGAIINAMALHGGLIPLGSTFLIFSDYMRHTIRLAAIMKIRSIFVYTHDSIGVGEDGPTHQPIEQISSLRAIPDLALIRPGDANETRAAWRVAIERKHAPTLLILSRQALPTLEEIKPNVDEHVKQGGYVLSEAKDANKIQLILMASGSEVGPALVAKQSLEKEGVSVRLVSMPSIELFRAQKQAYKDSVLPKAVRARLSIEAGAVQSWYEFVGIDGACIGMERFGASAPGGTNMKKFGFTPENIIQKAKSLLK